MRILNLGAGVQSTAVFLMAHEGLIPPIDHAIFADTQEEPQAVYDHLAWLRTIGEPVPLLHVATAGKLGDDISECQRKGKPHKVDGYRFTSIPAFTGTHHEKRSERDPCNEGIIRRQCTKEYKIEVVERVIRRVILGMAPKQRIPKGILIDQIFGISLDEKRRAERIVKNWEGRKWSAPSFPLIEKNMTRLDCLDYLKTRVPHTVTRSACVFCPFKSATEWLKTKANPKEWARAVEIDNVLRQPGGDAKEKFNQAIYLHRSLIPLEMVDLEKEAEKERKKAARPLFDLMECEGMCGL
jgi:hypothetical protein